MVNSLTRSNRSFRHLSFAILFGIRQVGLACCVVSCLGLTLTALSQPILSQDKSSATRGEQDSTEQDPANQHSPDFNRDVKPILRERCFACHGSLKQESSLRLDSAALLLKGGDSGEIIDRQDVSESELILRLVSTYEGERMPPEGKPLTVDEIKVIRQWIQSGAKIPENDQAEDDPRSHWAFLPPVKAAWPAVRAGQNKISNPIDRWLAAKQESLGIHRVEQAPRGLQLRRLYLDLVGVPPTLEELEAFETDSSPRAWDDIVDQLLQSPRYGERWGRHFMDIWRYSDWYGLGAQLRYSQKHIWHWRDWIVESLNEDKPYDAMIREMLAADELYPLDRDRLRATGFLARNYYLFNRTTWLDSTIEHTSKAFLGLTTNCSKCHDHKYDPISQQDYYRLRAVFEPHQVRLDPLPGESNLEKAGLPRVFDAHPEQETWLHLRGDEKSPDRTNPISPGAFSFFKFRKFEPQAQKLPAEAINPSIQEFVLEDRLRSLQQKLQTATTTKSNAAATLNRLRQETANRPMPDPKVLDYTQVRMVGSDREKNEQEVKLWLSDEFNALNPKKWQVVGGKWKVSNGRLVQSEIGAAARLVETIDSHPADFILETVVQVQGGEKWKSFGIRFDANADHDKTVYLSGYKPSKVQVSYRNGNQQVYPDSGRRGISVLLNRDYRLRIAVRGSLVNVAVDRKHLLSFKMPGERVAGKLQLMSFDSVASFDQVAIAVLDPLVRLEGESPAMTEQQAELQMQLAAANLDVAAKEISRVKMAYQADLAVAKDLPNQSARIEQAARLEKEYQLALLQRNLIEARVQSIAATDIAAKKKDQQKAMKKVESLKASIAAAKKALQEPGTQYVSIRASQKALEGPAEKPDSRNKAYPKISTGRRTEFAEWITDRQNPLTARVIVNHVWLRHFGQPLVESVTDFGRRAPAPAQQELLDWLAVDLMEHGWSLKHLHRLIVKSEAYRLSSRGRSHQHELATDPENRTYWRRMPARMESQVIRDSLLKLSGRLVERLGGPPLDPVKQQNENRRSLYFRQSRDHQNKFVGMFDDADILRCYRRQESIIPQQSLAMSNSQVVFDAAKKIASDLNANRPDSNEFIRKAFRLLLARDASAAEIEVCLDGLKRFQDTGADEARGRTLLVLSLLNHNDFVTIR